MALYWAYHPFSVMGFLACKMIGFLLLETPRNPLQKPPKAGSDVEMMGLLGAGNNPMVGMTVAVAVAVAESKK